LPFWMRKKDKVILKTKVKETRDGRKH